MDQMFSEEQEMLKQTARKFLASECPTSLVKQLMEQGDERGYPPELWRKMAEMRWMALPFPEEYGGLGGNFLDLAVLLEEMGRACLPGPYFSTVVLGGMTILEGGSEKQKGEFLPGICGGETIITMAPVAPSAGYIPEWIATKDNGETGGYVIQGSQLFVPDAHVADYFLCAARTGSGHKDITFFVVDSKSQGVKLTPLVPMAGDKQFEVSLEKVKVGADSLLGEIHKGWGLMEKVFDKAAVAKCAEMVGGAQRVLEMTVEYAKMRIQFGRPIGSFQAVQHHCTNMLVDVEGARFLTYLACWKMSEGLPCRFEVSAAKAWTSESFRRITALGQQVQGGPAFLLEHDMPLYYKRAKQWENLFGGGDFYREIVAQELGI